MKTVSRKEAKELGLTLYYTGKPCKYGHYAERWVTSKKCRECQRLQSNDYNKRHRESNAAYALDRYYKNRKENIKRMNERYYQNREYYLEERKRYYYENLEYEAARTKRYREENKEKMRQIHNQYRRENPGIYNAAKARYKASKKRATPRWADSQAIAVVYKKAHELSESWGIEFHVDHIAPINSDWVCGLHVWDNLQILDANTNCRKNNGRPLGE